MATTIPKRVLVKEIIQRLSEHDIRSSLHLEPTTDISTRLPSLKKAVLEQFLREHDTNGELIASLEERYALASSRTMFLPKIEHPDLKELSSIAYRLSQEPDSSVLRFGTDKSVRAVYIDQAPALDAPNGTLELMLNYEHRIEYRESDREADDYGEQKVLYGLEQAAVWIFEDRSHAVICCSGTATAQAIVRYCNTKLGIDWWIPNLTDAMFERLTSGVSSSSATFMSYLPNVPTITIYSRSLEATDWFKELQSNQEQRQTAAFGRDPQRVLPQFGVSSRNARVWTPYKLAKPALMIAAKEITGKIDAVLKEEFSEISKYLQYFADAPVSIFHGKKLSGEVRRTFLDLMEAILTSVRNNNQHQIDSTLLVNLVRFQKELDLNISTSFDCPNCGGGLGRCSTCLTPYVVQHNGSDIQISCPQDQRLVDTTFKCECGTELTLVSLESNIVMTPGVLLLRATEKFFRKVDELNWSDIFLVDGGVLQVLSRRKAILPPRIYLHELASWRTTARHATITISPKQRKKGISILEHTKEKCRRDNKAPTIEKCRVCLNSVLQLSQFAEKAELCLPRIFGIPIGRGFDGIHHGHEIADIKYEDVYQPTDRAIRVGIHLKSRVKSVPRGLGRSVSPIKGLYTQVAYSAYLVLKKKVEFDVIGISIPNTIHSAVVDSIETLLNHLGLSLLVVDEEEWLKIMAAALEQIEFSGAWH